jgi:hypothetical protein
MVELTLEEMLADPIVRLVMQRDHVAETEVRAVMTFARVGLERSLPGVRYPDAVLARES